jgi:hypothetical protein
MIWTKIDQQIHICGFNETLVRVCMGWTKNEPNQHENNQVNYQRKVDRVLDQIW